MMAFDTKGSLVKDSSFARPLLRSSYEDAELKAGRDGGTVINFLCAIATELVVGVLDPCGASRTGILNH
jgi:hypothetical protein